MLYIYQTWTMHHPKQPGNGRVVYPDLHHPRWTTSYHDGCRVSKLLGRSVWYRSSSWVWLEVKFWLIVCYKPIRHGSCTIQHPGNGRMVYSDLHYPAWTTSYHDGCAVLKMSIKPVWYRSTSWVWLEVVRLKYKISVSNGACISPN